MSETRLTTPGSAGPEAEEPAPVELDPGGGAAPACVLIKFASPAGLAPIIYRIPPSPRSKSKSRGFPDKIEIRTSSRQLCAYECLKMTRWTSDTDLPDLLPTLDHDKRRHRPDPITGCYGLEPVYVDFLRVLPVVT